MKIKYWIFVLFLSHSETVHNVLWYCACIPLHSLFLPILYLMLATGCRLQRRTYVFIYSFIQQSILLGKQTIFTPTFNIFINIWTPGWDLLNLGFCDHSADPLSCFAEWHMMASAEGEVAFCWSPSVWVLCQSAEFIFRLLSQINAVIYTDFLQ